MFVMFSCFLCIVRRENCTFIVDHSLAPNIFDFIEFGEDCCDPLDDDVEDHEVKVSL